MDFSVWRGGVSNCQDVQRGVPIWYFFQCGMDLLWNDQITRIFFENLLRAVHGHVTKHVHVS